MNCTPSGVLLREHNGEEYPEYIPPFASFLGASLMEFRYMFERYCNLLGYKMSEFSIDEERILRAYIRVDQRKLHYKMYHRGTLINELKEIALLCYWLSKYKAIVRFNGRCYSAELHNEAFPAYLMLCTVVQHRKIKSLPASIVNADIVRDFVYSLASRNISFDSIMLFVEALGR